MLFRSVRLSEAFLKVIEGDGFAQPNPRPMFANPPAILGLPAGVVILLFGGFMMFMGFMFIRKIVDIEV